MRKCYIESRRRGIFYVTVKRRQGNWFGHILRRNCLLKHAIKGKRDGWRKVTGRQGRRNNQLLEIERVSTTSHFVENALWKRLRTCPKTDCGLNE
jgi:hypothetical protein